MDGDALHDALGVLGGAGAVVTTWLARNAEKLGKSMLAAAEKAEQATQAVESMRRELKLKAAAADVRGLEMSVEQLQNDLSDLRTAPYRGRQTSSAGFPAPSASDPDVTRERVDGLARRVDALESQLREIRGDLTRERGARHSLGRKVDDWVQRSAEVQRQWSSALSKMEGSLGTFQEWMRRLP